MTTATKGRACDGKLQHPTKTDADKSRWRLVHRRGANPGRLDVYRCPHGDHWHVGHRARHTGRRR